MDSFGYITGLAHDLMLMRARGYVMNEEEYAYYVEVTKLAKIIVKKVNDFYEKEEPNSDQG